MTQDKTQCCFQIPLYLLTPATGVRPTDFLGTVVLTPTGFAGLDVAISGFETGDLYAEDFAIGPFDAAEVG